MEGRPRRFRVYKNCFRYRFVLRHFLWLIHCHDLDAIHAACLNPKPLLKDDKEGGRITLESETTLSDIPLEAWGYRFADHMEKVTDLLVSVTTVSLETKQIVAAMKGALR